MSETLDKFNYAVYTNKTVHPEFNICDFVSSYFLYDFDSTYFTKTNNVRKIVESLSHNELVYEIGKFAMECGALYEKLMHSPKYTNLLMNGRVCYEFYLGVQSGRIDSFAYLLTHKELLSNLSRAFGYYTFVKANEYYSLINYYHITCPSAFDEMYERMKNVNNVKVRSDVVNKCIEDIKTGKQVKLAHSEYSLDGKMFTVSDVGRKRKNQEDSTLIAHHPDNHDYKIIAVADGMGGLSSGDVVSNYTVDVLSDWFVNLPVEYLDNPQEIVPMIGSVVSKINKDVYNRFKGNAGCTLVFALVVNGETVVVNIGDSRCYAYSDGHLNQVTDDDSVVYKYYKRGMLSSKDDIRFHPDRNVITRAIGSSEIIAVPSIYHLKDYDLLLLFSDGVTDFLSDSQIKLCAENADPSKVASMLVEHAKYEVSRKKIKLEDGTVQDFVITGGSDNLTAAVYNRRG